MAVCGVLSGADSIAAIHEFAVDRRNWFARYLDLSPGIPCEDTFARVLARIDPAAFEKCLLGWIKDVQELTADRVVAIDGKTLRGSADREAGRAAIHMVSAWATNSCRWARSSSGRKPTRSPRSRNFSNCWTSPGAGDDR